jgi:phage terminase large subunit GpA-like protein
MSLFDSVYVPCPECGQENEFQTKGMPQPYMNRFPPDAVPLMAAAYIVTDDNDQIPDEPIVFACNGCEIPLRLELDPPLPATVAFRLIKAGRNPA